MNITGIKNYNISDKGAFRIKHPTTIIDRRNPSVTLLNTDDVAINTRAIESIIRQNSKITILTKDTIYKLSNVNIEKFYEAYDLASQYIEGIFDSFEKFNYYIEKERDCGGGTTRGARRWEKGYDPKTNTHYI